MHGRRFFPRRKPVCTMLRPGSVPARDVPKPGVRPEVAKASLAEVYIEMWLRLDKVAPRVQKILKEEGEGPVWDVLLDEFGELIELISTNKP